jgi:APA family basic amino acid/polyamine antiporter
MRKERDHQANLKPTLGLFDATAISVGAIIGGGIFVVTGIAARYAGSAIVISMLIAAVISLLTASSFIKLTAWSPREGSIYEYTYQLISPFAGFMTGWMWILSNTFAGAAVSLGFAYYVNALFPGFPPNIVAATICIAFALLNYHGVRESAFVNNLLVVAKLLLLAFFIIYGLPYAKLSNFVPFAPFETGVLYGACLIFFAYGGFARVAVIAEEVEDAKRNVPRAIILSMAISTVVYVLVSIVAVGLVGATGLAGNPDSPLAGAIGITGNAAAVYAISVGAILATASVLLTSLLGVSRMTYAMARKGDLPRILSRLHSKYDTPYYAVLMTGVLMALLVLLVDLTKVVAVSTFALLFYYTLTNFSAMRLENRDRVYRRIVPALGVITCMVLLVLIIFISPQAWVMGITGLAAGTVYYAGKKRLHRKAA